MLPPQGRNHGVSAGLTYIEAQLHSTSRRFRILPEDDRGLRRAPYSGRHQDLRQGEHRGPPHGRSRKRRGGPMKSKPKGPLGDGIELYLAHKRSLGKQLAKGGPMLHLLDGYLLTQGVAELRQITP